MARHDLPFDGTLLEDALGHKPASSAQDDMTTAEMLEWLSSDSVCKWLKLFKSHIFDNRDMRWWLEGGCSTNLAHSWDTIDTLIRLCVGSFGVSLGDDLPEKDGFEATAWIAMGLVLDDERRVQSPFQGLRQAGAESWCANVAVRILISVFCDLLRKPDGYFAKLLGGPKPKAIRDKGYRKKIMVVNNSPAVKDSEMKGPHAYGMIKHLAQPKEADSSEDEEDDTQGSNITRMERRSKLDAMDVEQDNMMVNESAKREEATVEGPQTTGIRGLDGGQQWSFDALN